MSKTTFIKRIAGYQRILNCRSRLASHAKLLSIHCRSLIVEQLEQRQLLTGDIHPLVNIHPSGSAFSEQFFVRSQLTELNGAFLFPADDSVNGRQLWRSDGTASGTAMVKQIWSGGDPFVLMPKNNQDVDGAIYFSATDGAGHELWRSDGTEAGTFRLKDIHVGPGSSYPAQITRVNSTVFFNANDGSTGWELWKTDGTEAGTVLVKDIQPGSGSGGPSSLTNFNGHLYFTADDGTHGYELWKSDGTESGTVMVKNIRPGGLGSFPNNLTVVGDFLYFTATEDDYSLSNEFWHGEELWRTDGTEDGTVRVKDINPGEFGSYPSYLTEMDGVLYFFASDGVHGRELWKSDGTEAGTTMVKDIRVGEFPWSSTPVLSLINVGGTLFFTANDGTSGYELWKSDGTEAGTVMVKDIRPGAADGFDNVSPYLSRPSLTNVLGKLYFVANDGTNGFELWKSDGSEEGTVMVMNIAEGSASSTPRHLTVMGDRLAFSASTATYGRELYILQLPTEQASVQASYIYHAGSSFAGSGIQNALDTSKQLAKEGNEPLTLTYDNLINSSRGINGLVFDIQNLPGGPSANLTVDDFEFQMSPTGAFIEADHPPAGWGVAPAPSSINVVAGSQGSPDRVVLQWPDNAIANRWLRITVKATANTGLPQPEVYYIGHLLGETTGASGGVYTVSFADITPIRSAVGQSVSASSIHDIDKNGTVAFADISAMRPNVGVQLTNITIPAGNASSGESGGERLSSPQSGTGKGRVGGAGGWSLLQMPAVPMSSTLPTTSSRPTANRPDVIQTHSGLPENKPLVKAEGVENRDPWLGELDVLLEDAAIVRYWTSDSAVEEEAGIQLLRLSMESSLKSRIAPSIR
jgi:ELWxxDGT repeat protein